MNKINKYGEVFTPVELVNKILDILPNDIWSDPTLKWLDPSNGKGIFPIEIIKRLMVGLEIYEIDKEKRYKYILDNMIYTCEIQSSNNKEYIKRVKYNGNNYVGSFLDGNFNIYMKNTWGIDEFDIIVGNPPYQYENKGGDNKLYLDFTKKSIELLKENGYLLYITPKSIIDYLTNVNKRRKYIPNFLDIINISIDIPNKYFTTVASTFCYFLLRNRIIKEKEQTIDYVYLLNGSIEKVKASVYKGEKLPRIVNEEVISILNKIKKKYTSLDIKKMAYSKGNRKVYRRIRKEHIENNIVSLKKEGKYIYPILDNLNNNKIYYFDIKMDDYYKEKILLSNSGYLSPRYNKGGYNLSDNISYLNIDNNHQYESMKRLIETKLFKLVLYLFYSNHGYDNINVFDKIGITLDYIWNDELIYEYYGINENEIDFIEKIIK